MVGMALLANSDIDLEEDIEAEASINPTPPPICGPLAYGTQIVHYGYSLYLYLYLQ